MTSSALITAIFALTVASHAFALSPISPTYPGQMKDVRFGVSPTKAVAVRWNPEKDEAPLSVRGAIREARIALKKLIPHGVEHFACYDVAIEGAGDSWYYVVRFLSMHASHSKKLDRGIYPAIIPFIVYADGSVEMPFEQKEPIQPAQPTPGS
ncbi:hypothetical protein [Oleiharenicola sp. Vm1]|uniref:hypothetical protein n=1 Tax=Oleiharenicola sp. Vm1 TaxID=3398393 RepID=UPI0039F5D45F